MAEVFVIPDEEVSDRQWPKRTRLPRTNPAEIENLIEQIRGTNLDPRAKEKIERLLRTVLTLVELLQRKNTLIKKLREMIFGKRTERHQARKAEGQEKVAESEKSDDGQPKAAGDQDARAELRAIGSEEQTETERAWTPRGLRLQRGKDRQMPA